MMRQYTIYRNEQPFASTWLNGSPMLTPTPLSQVLGVGNALVIAGTTSRYVLKSDPSVQFTVIRLPSDDDDCAAWTMTPHFREVFFISADQLAALPEFVTETLNIHHCLSVENGQMYSPTMEQLFDHGLDMIPLRSE